MILQDDMKESLENHEMIFPIDPIDEEGKEHLLKEALCHPFLKRDHNEDSNDLISLYRESNGTLHVKVIIKSHSQLEPLYHHLVYNPNDIWTYMQENGAMKNDLNGDDIKIDLKVVQKEYSTLSQKFDTLTADQERAIDTCTKNSTVSHRSCWKWKNLYRSPSNIRIL